MGWTKYKIEDIIKKCVYGSMPKQECIVAEGYPIFSGYRYSGYYNKYNIKDRTIIVVARGVGGTGDVRIAPAKCFLTNLSIALDLKEEIVDIDFLYFYLNQQGLRYLDSGAAQSQITISNLQKHIVFLPDLPIQQKIASILSTYDNLIENNTKRIKLLEQMAENLYKEWFVRFRFPGHENTPMENGLPKGWKKVVASSIIDVMSGGTPKTEYEEFYGGTIPFYTPKDAGDSIFVYRTITNITDEGLAHCNSQLYPKGALMITARGTVGKLSILGVPMAMNQSCFALQLKTKDNPYYLYYTMKEEVARLKKMANGGVFDTIVVKTFDHIKVLFPSDKMLVLFSNAVSPILDQIKALTQQNANLTRQRDLLLPRLMSGKLEVTP